eukprot:gene10041-2214_t
MEIQLDKLTVATTDVGAIIVSSALLPSPYSPAIISCMSMCPLVPFPEAARPHPSALPRMMFIIIAPHPQTLICDGTPKHRIPRRQMAGAAKIRLHPLHPHTYVVECSHTPFSRQLAQQDLRRGCLFSSQTFTMPKNAPLPTAPSGSQQPAEAFDMVFHCQLAHGSPTKQIRDFTNVKQLYEAIAKAFSLSTGDLLYCTLNTHKVDMTRLLGGQIGLDDFLFAHVKGESKVVKVVKDGPALGLTISDNGAGYAFIKKIREDSIMSKVKNVSIGDHIASINGQDLTGCRHFEVARMLKEIPIGAEFTVTLVEPKKAFDEVAGMKPRTQAAGTGEVKAGAGKKTLRMKRDGNAVVEDVPTDAVTELVSRIDDLLENFVGIKDQELSTSIYDLAKAAKEADVFAGSLDEQLADFEFPDDFVLDVFELVHKNMGFLKTRAIMDNIHTNKNMEDKQTADTPPPPPTSAHH